MLDGRPGGFFAGLRRTARSKPPVKEKMRKQAQTAARSTTGVALAAVRGASRAELLQTALAVLLQRSGADRAGIWLVRTPGEDFCWGEVSDAHREAVPREWTRLNLQTVLPREERGTPRSISQEVSESRKGSARAPLAVLGGLRLAMWVPLPGPGGRRGLLLAGWKNPVNNPPREAIEELAAELSLALQVQEAEAAAGARARELEFVRRVLTGGAREAGADLRELLFHGTREAGAEFLAVGRPAGKSGQPHELVWTVTEESLLPKIELEPLRGLWRSALESGRAAAAGPFSGLSLGADCEKWLALPLAAGGARAGVLLAGLRRGCATLAAFEWLRLRAALAAHVLLRENAGEPAVVPAAGPEQVERLAALGQSISGIAHELSNPLTSILVYAQRLLMREEFGENEEVRKIHDEAGRAARMLRQLLGGGQEAAPERQSVSLNRIVRRSLDLVPPEGRVRRETALEPHLPLLPGDPDRLQQVVLNLLTNAQHAIEQRPGEGRGTIRVATRRGANGRLVLEVSDDGPGIPLELLGRIFDPFFTTKPASAGTGLGLSIVREIVREHGGTIRAANRPGGGAVFTVEFPAAEQEDEAPPRPRKRTERGAPSRRLEALPGGRRAAGPRVLVVEDEPTVARLIADVLGEEGMQVEVLLDAGDALARASRRSFDLVICDLKMPGLDGRRFFQALERQDSPLCDRFLFVTGDALSPSTMDFLQRNRLAYVHKPFRVEELTRAVHELLKTGAVAAKHAAGRSRT